MDADIDAGTDADGDTDTDTDTDGDELLRLAADQVELTKRLRARIQELEYERTAPLAIVSTALRLPGGLTTPEAYWQFLLGDRDVNRFVTDVAGFDPAFFGMSQREAELTDPQQRLLLETAWEAFERAGIAMRRRDRLNAGVFIGIARDEYSDRLGDCEQLERTDRLEHCDRPRLHCDAAGRISQTIGLTGPSISVDSADSSSLVALHLAAQALRRGECRYALVGGASLMFSPGSVIEHRRSGALPPIHHSTPFTAAVDGPARGEGIAAVLLMRLRDAEREGRPIQAVLRGSAVMHTGASNATGHTGHTDLPVLAPDADRRRDAVYASLADACAAQQTVIRAALADACVAAHEVGVVETHAIGSRLGDPIEVGALDEVIGTAAPQRPVRALLSTLKPRLGHLAAAAGIAALIKVVLMLQHGVVPAAVPLEAGPLSEFVPWDRVRLLVPRVHTPWPIEYARRVAGISSFGEAGTNAHAIVEAYVSPPARATTESVPASAHPHLITLSARNATSLTEMAVAMSSYLVGTPPANLDSVAHTLHVGRTPFEHRVAVVGTSGPDLAEKLAVAVGHGNKFSTADGKATAASTRNTVTLRVGSGVVRLSAAINALTAAYPLLAPVVGATDLPPAERLKRLMLHLGLRVKSERRDPASGAAVAEVASAAGRSLR